MPEEIEVLDLVREVNTGVKGVVTRLSKVESDIFNLKQRGFRLNASGGADDGNETIGALVSKDARFASLQTAGRGIAQICVNRRLVEKSLIAMGPSLKPGVQSLPVVQLPGPAPTVGDLIPSRPLAEGTLQVVRQKSPHPVAGVQVVEGDVKKESTLTFESLTITPATLAIWVAASRQALRDVAGLNLVIDNELLYAVRILEETEILNGDGSQGHLSGIIPVATVLAPVVGDTPLDAVARGIGALASNGIQATGLVMNPVDWLSIMLAKNTTENYLLGSPASATASLVWGVPLALSTAIASGTFLVGNFALGAELAYREQAVIDISTEHADFFILNLICIRAEESVALAVKNGSYFLKSTLPAPAARNGGTSASRK